MPDQANAQIQNVYLNGTVIEADLLVSTSWGPTLTDHISAEAAGATPTQANAAVKNRVIAWAATLGKTLTAAQVWVFGGPQ